MSNDLPPVSTTARRSKKYLIRGVILGAVLTIGLAAVFRFETRPEISVVGQGKALAVSNGCFACHGASDSETRHNLRQTSAGPWKQKAIPTFWENGIDDPAVLIDWITHGVPEGEAAAHKRLFIQMPAYQKFMTTPEIESVAAWILSEGIRLSQASVSEEPTTEMTPEQVRALAPDELLVMGDRLSRRHGCYQCHGELGQGGAENPSSFKSYIPGFFGSDFQKLTDGGKREEIMYWIEQGRGQAIEAGAMGTLAKRYLDSQAIGMPAYRDQLSTTEKNILTEYLLWLNKEGPLSVKQLQLIMKQLSAEPAG